MGRRRKGNAVVEDVVCVYETDNAIKIYQEPLPEKEIWVPKSQIAPHSEVSGSGDEGLLVVARWFAEKYGLIES